MAFKPPGAARRARTGKTRTMPVEREPRGRVPHCRRLPDLQVYSSRKPWGRAWRTGYLARLIPLRYRVRFPEPQPEHRRRCRGLRTPTTKHTHNQIISQPNRQPNRLTNKRTSIHTYTHTLFTYLRTYLLLLCLLPALLLLPTSLYIRTLHTRCLPIHTPCLCPSPALPTHTRARSSTTPRSSTAPADPPRVPCAPPTRRWDADAGLG